MRALLPARLPTRLPALARLLALGLLLAVVTVVVPDSATPPDDVTVVAMPHARGLDGSDRTVWILAVGSDARPGQDMTRSRGDALQLVGLDTRTGAAASIGIPRDMWVPIPGHGSNRVNAALYFGGPRLLGRTVAAYVGIRPDYVMVTRFTYFEQMIRDIGGITVHNPRAFADEFLKPKGFPAGTIRLGGYDAMAFSRIRHSLPGGDYDRSANQQRVLRGIAARVRQRADQPGFLERGALSVLRHTHADASPAELFTLAQAVAQVQPSRITTCVLRGSFATIGGASVIRPDVAYARRLARAARRDATLPRHC
ncbi:LCP family protein [Nocardioides sp. GY 10127]|uniref:LCP family protein n=1 Tax=Nocardioides sp. GY 10127 TaxID=2569762 RepID=UPI0010A8AD03|nr:LCP family protein [Nocardioides sp. GY 10127]TIC84093.1 LytR family transcriptional regulator [Nocardioides sp. GY 10127]